MRHDGGKIDVLNYNHYMGLKQKTECVLKHAETMLSTKKIYWHQFLLLQCDYLIKALKTAFFMRGDKYQKGQTDVFNRNIVLHLLQVPDAFISNTHSLRLFLFLDILAILYAVTHNGESGRWVSPVRDRQDKQELMNIYWDIYKKCAMEAAGDGDHSMALHNRIYSKYRF